MLRTFQSIAINGVIVIGDSDSAEDGLLPVGAHVGNGVGPELDVALDPLEGAAICATGGYNALSIIAIAERGGFLRCPDMHMEKIAVGPEARGVIDLDRSPTDNLRAVAEARGVYVADITVAILDRPRHEKIIASIRAAGASIQLITDGDVAGVIATTEPETTGIDIYIGQGGAPEGVLAAAALRCVGGQFQTRLVFRNDNERRRAEKLGIRDLNRKYTLIELASGDVVFSATGVTDGSMLEGVHVHSSYVTTHSIVMRSATKTVRWVKMRHPNDDRV